MSQFSSLLLSLLLCLALLFSNQVHAKNIDLEVNYINYLLNEVNDWMVNENHKRMQNYTDTVNQAIEAERDYLEPRLSQEAFENLTSTYINSVRGAEMREQQKTIFLNLIRKIENMLNFKYSVVNNGMTAHHPARACSDVRQSMPDYTENGDIFWMNPERDDRTFQQYCDMKNGGWGLFAKVGAGIPRGEVALAKASVDETSLLDVAPVASDEASYFRGSRFTSYGKNWILRLDTNGESIYFTPRSTAPSECTVVNIGEICGACPCKTYVSEQPVNEPLNIPFTTQSQNPTPDNGQHMTYYLYTSPSPAKE